MNVRSEMQARLPHLIAALAVCAGLAAPAWAQPAATSAVAPPARAGMALSGSVLAARNTADYPACQSECQRTPGCTGYNFDRAAKASCTLLGGKLSDLAARGAVSCRMPCTPSPGVTAQPQRSPGAAMRDPLPAGVLGRDRPVSLLLPPPAAAASVAGTGTASTQAASYGTGSTAGSNLPPCPVGQVVAVGSCSSAAVATAAAPAQPPASTTITLVPVNDNTIASSSLSAAYETSTYQFGYWTANPGIGMGCDQLYVALSGAQHLSCARGLIKFNLATLAGKTIQSATLRLTTSAAGVGAYKDPWYIAASASAWSGTAVTWINYGDRTYVASIANQSAPTQVGQVFNLDQTATVRNWVSGAYANNGFAMALTREQLRNCSCISLDHFEFHSNEDAGGRGPKLIVTYQ